ncbi:MAG: extracellular solute-binding protein [Eubacteriales bacterium]|nr:extracellular solute-binding protein [Eubacteriales bacterium]
MKKKVLSVLLACAMVFGLAACGSETATSTPATEPAAEPAAEEAATEAAAEESVAADVDYGTGTITIWVAEEVNAFTQAQADQFIADHPEFSGYTVTIEAVGEGDAANNMITDVEGGADIYGFAQDQLARLVSAGAVMEVIGDYADFVSSSNDAGAVSAATMGDAIYAFPVTSDNGYFLYYDSTVVTDPTSLEAILADCETAGKSFYMEINSGWYQPAFFFGTGCELTYEADSDGNFTQANVNYASENGVAAMKALVELSKSSAFINGSSVSNATNAAAIVDGTWDSSAAKELFGDGYACAKLPTFTVDDQTYQLSGFGGFKLLGVKPQTDTNKATVCMELAKYLSSAEVQLARYNEVGWGPSNLEAQADEAVKADEALSALAEQLAYTIPQGQYPNDYWSLATALGDDIIADKYDNASDEDLMKALEEFQATCESYAAQ